MPPEWIEEQRRGFRIQIAKDLGVETEKSFETEEEYSGVGRVSEEGRYFLL